MHKRAFVQFKSGASMQRLLLSIRPVAENILSTGTDDAAMDKLASWLIKGNVLEFRCQNSNESF